MEGSWHVYTYRTAGAEVRKIASALTSKLPSGSTVAILSKNCAHWIMADLAIMMSGNISVPIYPTLSAEGIRPLLEHSECKAIFLGKLDDFEKQKSAVAPIAIQISFPFYGPGQGLKWDELLKEFEPSKNSSVVSPESVATIMYSSGTTGTAKGVMLSHAAFGYVGKEVSKGLGITKPEKFFSYLPLSHIAERALMEMVVLASGSTIGFAESLDKFQQNLQAESPTIFGGVPRIYAKFQEGILKKLPQAKLDKLLAIPIISSIIKKSIRKKLGFRRSRVIVSGAAPTPVSLLEWFKKLGIDVAEIYGMTENTAYSHANFQKIKIGTVGEPWAGVECRVSEDGEIQIKHRALMTGYFKDAATTKEVFTEDGFLKTGDKGTVDNENFLTITGRVKDQFKTAKAKFIAPAPIELKLLSNTLIEQACVVGMNLPQPIALVLLSQQAAAKSQQEIVDSLFDSLTSVNLSLESFEKVHKIVVLQETWSIENGLLTPSLKLKRQEVEKKHASRYDEWFRRSEEVVLLEEIKKG
jgi:long-chain acyl-CoA synthetase